MLRAAELLRAVEGVAGSIAEFGSSEMGCWRACGLNGLKAFAIIAWIGERSLCDDCSGDKNSFWANPSLN